MAGTAPSDGDRQHKKQGQHKIIGDVSQRRVNRDNVVRKINRVNPFDTAGKDEPQNKHSKPDPENRIPDDSQLSSFYRLIIDRRAYFTERGDGAEPAAPGSPEEYPRKEQQTEKEDAPGNNPLKRRTL